MQAVRRLIMRYWLYRWFMEFAHRHGWHKMDEFHPEGDTLLWCQWCGLRVVTKRHLTQRAQDVCPAGGKHDPFAKTVPGCHIITACRKCGARL